MKKKLLLSAFTLLYSLLTYCQVPELWGMTTYGGTSNSGTIFKINGDGTGFNSLFSFDASTGYVPRGSLCLGPNGKLYGTTNGGGSQSVGTLFCYEPSTGIFTKIVDFNYTNGAYPWGSLTLANNGFLYGNSYGGTTGNGNIFRVSPGTNIFTPLYNLQSGDGASPGGKMVKASNGLLYGMTAYGGANSGGTIFSFNTVNFNYSKLYDFNTTDGKTGYGSLCEASDTNLYGLTRNGGAYGVGVLFRFDPSNNAYTKLVDFDTTGGKWPWNGIMQASGTKLYGLVTNGGALNQGVIFSYDFLSGIYTVEHSFDMTNGAVPFGGLMTGSDGFYYGMTFNGGSNLMGASFRFDPVTDSLTVIHHFNGSDGANPSGDFLEPFLPNALYEINEGMYVTIYPNPLIEKLTIVFNDLQTATSCKMCISNAIGEIIEGKEIAPTVYPFTYQWNLENLPDGIYFLKISSGNYNVCKKIIKQNFR